MSIDFLFKNTKLQRIIYKNSIFVLILKTIGGSQTSKETLSIRVVNVK